MTSNVLRLGSHAVLERHGCDELGLEVLGATLGHVAVEARVWTLVRERAPTVANEAAM